MRGWLNEVLHADADPRAMHTCIASSAILQPASVACRLAIAASSVAELLWRSMLSAACLHVRVQYLWGPFVLFITQGQSL